MDREMKNAMAITRKGAPKAKPAKRKTICNGCKYAEWLKTDTGRLSPYGSGRCTYSANYWVPASNNGSWTQGRGYQFEVRGSSIQRNSTQDSTWLSECPVREEA